MVKSLSRGEPGAASGCWHQIPASTEPQAPGMRPGSLCLASAVPGREEQESQFIPSFPSQSTSPLLAAIPSLPGMIPGPDGSGRQGQVPLENLLFQPGGILAGGCGRSSPGGLGMSGKFPNSELTPRSLGWVQGSQGADPGCILRDFSVECPSPGRQGVTAGSTGEIQGILQHPKAAGASLSPRQWHQP